VGADGIVIGREADPQRRTVLVAQGGNGVSRQHCEVVLRDGELKLRDLSSYGTFVNESKTAGETTLKAADVIRIGSPGAELHVVSLEGEE
jgi:pSer/pThr/pTyr-binding forkhead associated (FHA) protein